MYVAYLLTTPTPDYCTHLRSHLIEFSKIY